ncbi:MAG: aminoglycoside phosphotransferase family protein [Actinomycetota bacterium]
MERGRIVTLVLVDEEGEPLGSTEPFPVAEPWWPETGPIHDAVAERFGDRLRIDAVLRLLLAEPDPDEPMGGRVTYAAVGAADHEAGLTPTAADELALLAPATHRLPWAEPFGPATDLAWVAQRVEVIGPPRQHRSWNLSAVWSIPTAKGTVWLKCLPPFLAHEPVLLDRLSAWLAADDPIAGTQPRLVTPELLAADDHRVLLAPLPGEDGYRADDDEQVAMITTLVDIQATTVDRVDELVDAGVPDLRAAPLAAELTALVTRVGPDRPALLELIDGLEARLDQVARLSPPDSLVHGDPHPGNARRLVEPPVWFDWGDAFVGNPLLDLAATHRLGPVAVEAWLAALVERWPGCDPGRALDLLAPVAALRQAWVYQRFLDGIESTEHVYHCDDVGEALDATEAILARRADG